MRAIFFVCILTFFATSCAKVPSQSSYSYSYQHKVQSADHWERFAKDVVSDQVLPLFKKQEPSFKLYVQQIDKSDFGMAFSTYLATDLLNNRIHIAETYDANTVVLDWSVQHVKHSGNRNNPNPAGGIVGSVGYLAAEFFGGSFYYPFEKVPNSEIIISVRIKNNNKTLSIKTETFYINDSDTANYWFIDGKVQELAYIKTGSLICKEKNSMYALMGENSYGYSQVDTYKASGSCAATSKNHPVEIVDDDGQLVVIRSIDNADTYVASSPSVVKLGDYY